MTSTVGRLVIDVQTNKSGGAVAYGDVVVNDTANDHAFTTTTSGAFTAGVVGVCIEPNGIASNATGRIQFQGYCAQVNANASVTRGYFLKTFTVAKQATGSATRVVGSFGVALKTSSTPDAVLWGFPDASSATGNVATDPIWTTAGQLAVATGSSTAAAVNIGNAGGAVSRINGALAWNSGTSFPTAATGDRYWRTDLGFQCYYDGTRWLTMPELIGAGGMDLLTGNQSGAATTVRWSVPSDYDMWIYAFYADVFVNGTNDGTKYWTFEYDKVSAANASTSLGTFNTSADSASTWTRHKLTVGASVVSASFPGGLQVQASKTSTPANVYSNHLLLASLIVT